MAGDNNQYFEFQEMQLNWSIYRAKIWSIYRGKMVLINWLIDRADLALFVYLTFYMLSNVCLSTSTSIAIVSFS